MNKQKSFIASGSEIFKKKKDNGDIDVIETVRQLLINNGLSVNVELYFNKDKDLLVGVDKNPSAQIFLLNRYWQIIFLKLEETKNINTQIQRFCLSNKCTADEWLNSFKSNLLPFIIEHQLPLEL